MKTPPEPDDAIEQSLRASRRLEEAPEALIQRAIDLWQRPARAGADAPGALRRLLAALTFDSAGASPLAFGMRSAGGTTRQLLFAAEGHDIDLRVAPDAGSSGDHWLLSGQVLGPAAHGVVSITAAGSAVAGEAVLNEFGEFRMPALAPGEYILTLRMGDVEVVLPSIFVPQAI
jgi:hypothetical protein